MKFIKRNIPNFITLIRIFAAVAILFLKVLSIEFFLVYGICGMTDLLDGLVARKYNLESHFGSILDSIADLIFLGAMILKLFPVIVDLLAVWNWVIIIVPFALHMCAYLICALKFHKFSSLHTFSNKVLNGSLFFYPFFFIGKIRLLYEIYALLAGVNALYGSFEINAIHLIANEYNPHNKSIYYLLKGKEEKENIKTI